MRPPWKNFQDPLPEVPTLAHLHDCNYCIIKEIEKAKLRDGVDLIGVMRSKQLLSGERQEKNTKISLGHLLTLALIAFTRVNNNNNSSNNKMMSDAPNVTREQVMTLMAQRKDLEEELSAHLSTLQAEGDVGMDEPLVDREGYPRADVDVHKVRIARNRVICLRNDLKSIMDKIESGIHNLHEQSRDGIGGLRPSDAAAASTSTSSDSNPGVVRDRVAGGRPFAKVDIVSNGSPAERAGLKPGDLIVRFGSVDAENFPGALTKLAEVASHNRDRPLDIEVIRGGNEERKLRLIPTSWPGRGLLGCNLLIHKDVDKPNNASPVDR